MPRPSLPALRRVAVAAVAAAGVGMVATSVSGMARIDASLAGARTEQAPVRYEPVSLARRSGGCPEPHVRVHRSQRPAPVTY